MGGLGGSDARDCEIPWAGGKGGEVGCALPKRALQDQGGSTGGTFQEDIAKLAAKVKRETLGMPVIVTMVCFNEKVAKITSKL